MTTTHIELLRHGLPEGEACFRGHTDFAITQEGMEQMRRSVRNAKTAEVVVSSPLSRCMDFATEYAEKHNLSLVPNACFKELNFGDWDGVEKQKVWEADQDTLSAFWTNPWQEIPPNGESLEAHDKRVIAAWHELLTQYQGKKILLVTHGGVIKQILRTVLEMPKTETFIQRLDIPYAARVSISVYHDQDGKLWPQVHWAMR